MDEGLPSSRLDHLRVLENGELFIASYGTPCFYDGYTINTNSFKGWSWIWFSAVDANGTVWFVGSNGALMKLKGHRLHVHPANEAIRPYCKSMNQNSLAFDQHNVAYMGFSQESFYLKIFPDGTVEKVLLNDKIPPNSIYVESAKTLQPFFGSSPRDKDSDQYGLYIDGIKRYTGTGRSPHRVKLSTNDSMMAISCDKRLYAIESDTVKKMELASPINAVLLDSKSRIWVGHRQGVQRISKRFELEESTVLEKRFTTSICQDLEGTMWFATTNGLFKLRSDYITNYSIGTDDEVSEQSIPILKSESGPVFLSAQGVFTLENGRLEEQKAISYRSWSRTSFCLRDDIWTLNYTSTELIRISKDGKREVVMNTQKSNSRISSAQPDESGNIWLCNSPFLIRINQELQIDTIDSTILKNHNTLPYTLIPKVVSEKEIYLTIKGKLVRYNAVNKQLDSISVSDDRGKRVVKNVLTMESKKGVVFAGAINDGLWIVTEDSSYQITTKDGLLSEHFTGFYHENDSVLWVATMRGLHRFSYSLQNKELHYKIRPFTQEDGLPTSEINPMQGFQDRLWLCTRFGASSVSLSAFNQRNRYLAPAQISWLQVNARDTTHTQPLELKHHQNQLTFGFKAISFKPENQKKYFYRLLGENETWQSTTDTMVTYSSLPPGDFVFEVRTKGDGYADATISSKVTFSISKPFWQKTWFILSIILLAQLIAGLLVWLANRSKRRRLSLEKNVLTAELKALRAQLNPHFMFNALGAIQGSIMDGSTTDALQNIGKLAHLMRKMLYATRNKRTTLKEAVDVLRLYLDLELVRQPDKFTYDIEYDQSCEDEMETINIPPSIIQPFVENAVLHGASKADNKGLIKVKFEQFKDYIKCEISDNGPGYYKSQKQKKGQHRSLGLSIVREQIDLLNMDLESKITLKIEERMGTIVTVMMPVDF